MIAPEDVALVLLAAGRSVRFGDADKLEQPFLTEPLAFHVVTALAAIPFKRRIAVVSGTQLDFAGRGYEVVANPRAKDGQGHSLGLCIAAARRVDAKAVLVALADMPRVTAAHIWRLMDGAEGEDAVVASSDGARPMPPALFGRAHFGALLALEGDQGARDLVRAGHHVIASPEELADVDTPEDLAALRAKYAG
ncbi:nucleotidyltransferase family protein [Sphingomonas qomolangmaensis]|uniref:Nucleotidyltransferase family protein n=1 Tax=Sphingomonas qomolangmaensis TaxID=2918765 RepID=A0ABY5LD72_9SPHN|nr:nucleotidyltransferase family protein [Sphingomonas qomolangmaensis]UUL82666.1 nucleotidyltransferase family protein [Sphingomonas qomolangmaensis]